MDKRTFLKNASLLGIDILASIFALALCLFYCPNLLGQTQKQTFESIARKVSGKTWVIQKMCEDDSCYSNNYDGYFDFPKLYHKRGDTISFSYTHMVRVKERLAENDTGVWVWGVRTCSPVFVCYESSKPKTIHNIRLVYSDEIRVATLTMLTDSSFVVVQQFGKDSFRNSTNNFKEFYRQIATPE